MGQASGFLYSFPEAGGRDTDLEDFDRLLRQLLRKPSPAKSIGDAYLDEVRKQPNCFLYFMRSRVDNRIVATATLILYKVLSGQKAIIEDVVVDESHRGKGLAEHCFRALMKLAKVKGVKEVFWKSHPDRAAANNLYRKLGYQPSKSNLYQAKL